ncbi:MULTISPECIES: isochorismatase family protein [Pseudonocardia]|uniref:Streptothricin hydrolase n=2 Tax=Pseudonocardia TaxID=1847 RepID=A0A1Y2N1R6_PSEAH|nr:MULTISPECIES: isochorismatase family protein [Pseudonocardia]OSY41413.1 Streptothricin hydrolase [Pseudonocardia autotrophica]TDN71370.1 nicotinamidase-related amidase [Pseudonocardia autotrophica]BBG02047.1 hydrolase [Pseudonocardia autotrophica]GEC24061.1 hydrolase [Pseudonocardia saturnea]
MTTALLVIDVQESFRARPGDWAGVSTPDIADRVRELVRHTRARGRQVFWILHTEPGTGTVFDPAGEHVRLLPGLEPSAAEPVLHKTTHNAFSSTDLDERLRAAGVTDVVVCGIRTEQCCETTARLASDLGYGVEFVLDATATMPLPSWDGDGVLDPAQVLQRTASALQHRFATVTTLAGHLAS